MTKFLMVFFLILSSFNTASASTSSLNSYDGYKMCPKLRAYTKGYTVIESEIEECITSLEENQFQHEALLICINLPSYSYQYLVSPNDVLSCFDHIANKVFTKNRISYCKELQNRNGLMGTTPYEVTRCLK